MLERTSELTAADVERANRTNKFRITDFVPLDDLTRFTERNNTRATRFVIFNWAMVALIFAGVALWTNPLTILLGVALLGGRQLGFAALMHDCGHRALFEDDRTNAWVGQWLCAYPILSDLPRYAAGHRKHHAFAGSHDDPDLPNYQSYPVSRASFRRKVVRDLTGQTGLRALRATWARGKADLAKAPWNGNALAGHALVNAAMFAVLWGTGAGWLYLLWPAAYLTSYMLIARLRQIAEHGAVPDLFDPDPRKNTRTTLVRWFERPFVAPFNLNYHLEHHLHASIPCYQLPAFRHYLASRGIYDETNFPSGYGELFSETLRA
jgi:fatty acid desaturase